MSKKSRDRASAAMALLAERFPRCFDERNRRPLKIGINADVVVAMAGTMTARDVANALRFYTGSVLYQRALTAGAGRLDLDGNLAGTVTPQEEAAALTKQRAWAARKAAGAANTVKAKPQVADLKQAAKERKRRQQAGARANHRLYNFGAMRRAPDGCAKATAGTILLSVARATTWSADDARQYA